MPTTSNMISGQETSRVGYGNGRIGIVNSTGQNVGSIILGSHPESFQFEQNGARVYVNVPKQRGINVVDRKKRAVVPRWLWMTPTKGCSSGADSSLGLVVLDTTSGRIVTHLPRLVSLTTSFMTRDDTWSASSAGKLRWKFSDNMI